MDQISPPLRIVLAVAVVFAAAYMLVLKPKDEAAAPAPTPVTAPATEAGGPEANTSLGKAVESARETAGVAEAAQEARSGETQSSSATQAKPDTPAAKPAAEADKAANPALAKLPDWLEKSIDKKVVALLFVNKDAADDKRTANSLKRAYEADGKVVARSVPVAQISKYQGVAEGLDVSQSPTLLVIARDRSAQAVSGYASLKTINQAIIDGLLATDNPAKTVDFLKLAQREGQQISNRALVGVTEGVTPAGDEKNFNAWIDMMNNSLAELRNAPVPAAHKDVKRLLNRFLVSEIAVGKQILGAIGSETVDLVKVGKAVLSNDKLQARTLLELNAVGVDSFN